MPLWGCSVNFHQPGVSLVSWHSVDVSINERKHCINALKWTLPPITEAVGSEQLEKWEGASLFETSTYRPVIDIAFTKNASEALYPPKRVVLLVEIAFRSIQLILHFPTMNQKGQFVHNAILVKLEYSKVKIDSASKGNIKHTIFLDKPCRCSRPLTEGPRTGTGPRAVEQLKSPFAWLPDTGSI